MSMARDPRRTAGPERALATLLGVALLAACANPVSFDHCTFDPTSVSPAVPAEDFRLAVLAPPPLRDAGAPRIAVEIRPATGDPVHYTLGLRRLGDDPRMVTRETDRKVDYWRRYALNESSYEDYRSYRAQLDSPPGGAADVEATAWLVRAPLVPAGPAVRELRVRTDDAVGYDAICRP